MTTLDSWCLFQTTVILYPFGGLKKLLQGKDVANPPSQDYKIVEVAWGEATWYLTSHIPHALYLDTNNIESKPLWNKVSDEKLKAEFEKLGISHNTTVLLYGRNMSAAARAANIMMYAGVKDVRLINGGWQAWEKAKYPFESLTTNHAKSKPFGVTIPQHPEYIIGLTQAKKLLADRDHSSLVSIRSWPEYIGKTSGYSYIKPKGRIKGARWGHAGTDASHLQDFHNPDGTMISPNIIARNWNQWNILSDQTVAFYCGTGWRASEAFFYAYVMGWKNISVYDGGWYEWSSKPSDPIALGPIEPAKKIAVH